MEIFTTSAGETQRLGKKIAIRLIKQGQGSIATILALTGELGSGKTTFIQGLAKGLGLPHRILSPTFIVSREYPLHTHVFTKFMHIDLYRIEKLTELADFGLSEIFANPANLVAIEWAERLENKFTKSIKLTFRAISENKRQIVISGIDL